MNNTSNKFWSAERIYFTQYNLLKGKRKDGLVNIPITERQRQYIRVLKILCINNGIKIPEHAKGNITRANVNRVMQSLNYALKDVPNLKKQKEKVYEGFERRHQVVQQRDGQLNGSGSKTD